MGRRRRFEQMTGDGNDQVDVGLFRSPVRYRGPEGNLAVVHRRPEQDSAVVCDRLGKSPVELVEFPFVVDA